jgi:ATP-dependent protease ClpP protease subunit
MASTTEAGDDAIPVPDQTPLYYALEQPRYSRQTLIREIERRTGRRLIAYVAGPATSISSVDIPPFVDVLHDVAAGSDLDLLLHTPGGDVDQAERIVLLCRKRVGDGTFRVVVPDSAKSAGTLIAIAADAIVMGEPSELGPIDPQVTITTASGEPMQRPAQSFLDGLNEIITATEQEVPAAYFPLLDKLDPALIDFCRKALLRSEQFAETFLAKYMFRGDAEKARQVAHELNDVKKYLSHGAVIDAGRALDLGLNVELLSHDDDLWQAYWRLYCEMRLTWNGSGTRLYEGRKASLRI